MGDRYYLDVVCDCGQKHEDVYFAPTCGFTTLRCIKCKIVIDLVKYTGISYEDASNISEIEEAIDQIKDEYSE